MIRNDASEQPDPYQDKLNESLAMYRSEMPEYMPEYLRKRLFVTMSKNLGFTIFREKDLHKLFFVWRGVRRKFVMTLTESEYNYEMMHALDECELLFEVICRKSLDGFEAILEQSQIREINVKAKDEKKKHFWSRGAE